MMEMSDPHRLLSALLLSAALLLVGATGPAAAGSTATVVDMWDGAVHSNCTPLATGEGGLGLSGQVRFLERHNGHISVRITFSGGDPATAYDFVVHPGCDGGPEELLPIDQTELRRTIHTNRRGEATTVVELREAPRFVDDGQLACLRVAVVEQGAAIAGLGAHATGAEYSPFDGGGCERRAVGDAPGEGDEGLD